MSKHRFIIRDWAGNTKFNGEHFNSYEDAWEHIYGHAEGCEDGDFSDFYVEEV